MSFSGKGEASTKPGTVREKGRTWGHGGLVISLSGNLGLGLPALFLKVHEDCLGQVPQCISHNHQCMLSDQICSGHEPSKV